MFVVEFLPLNHHSPTPPFSPPMADRISSQKAAQTSDLKVVGVVASIDNDFVGTEMTIGSDTALNRIMECLDSLQTTATRCWCGAWWCMVMHGSAWWCIVVHGGAW